MKIMVFNKNCDIETFNKYKTKVYDLALEIATEFEIDTNIDIFICGEKSDQGFTGCCTHLKNKQMIDLFPSLFNREDDHLELVLFHELIHACDSYFVDSKKAKYKTYKQEFRDVDSFIINVGFNSWTEFQACYLVNKISNSYKFNYTFLDMVKDYELLLKKKEDILVRISNKEQIDDYLNEYIEDVQEFLYFTSRTMASIPFKNNNYDYCEKTKSKQSFKKIDKLYYKLFALYSKMFHGTYGKYLFNRLYKIGSLWFKEIFTPLNIGISKYNYGYDYMFFVEKEG